MDANARDMLMAALAENKHLEQLAVAAGQLLVRAFRVADLEGHPLIPALPAEVQLTQLLALAGPPLDARLTALLEQQAPADTPAHRSKAKRGQRAQDTQQHGYAAALAEVPA